MAHKMPTPSIGRYIRITSTIQLRDISDLGEYP